MSDIFISYNNKDKAKAELFARAFERESWSVFWDKAIPPGKTFDQYINEQLEAAKCVVVLWSEGSVNSDWVKEEAQRGVQRKILIPVFINKVTPPLGFGRIEAAELFDWEGDTSEVEFQNLVKAIETLIHRHTGEETLEERTPRSSVGAPPSSAAVTDKNPSVAPEPRFPSAASKKNKYMFSGLAALAALVTFFLMLGFWDSKPPEPEPPVRVSQGTISPPDIASQKEKEGYESLARGDYDNAISAFYAAEKTYPRYHQAYELARFLEKNKQDLMDPNKKKMVLKSVVSEYSAYAPKDSLAKIRKSAE